MRTTVAILTTAVSLFSFAQERKITGEIRDAIDKSNLPYANIGIANKHTGTLSNAEGKFSLKINDNSSENDRVTFSYVGYQTKSIPVSDLQNAHNIIELVPETQQLNEVVVKFVKPKARILGRNAIGLGLMHYNFYTYYEKEVDDRLSKEVGMKLKVKSDCKVNNLNFHITSNEFRSLKFRLNFYKIENGLPKELLIQKNIIFEIKDEFKGWYQVDLTPYDIYLDRETEEIAVTMQWAESQKANPNSKYFGISAALSATETCFSREKSMDQWNKSGQSLSFYLNTLCN